MAQRSYVRGWVSTKAITVNYADDKVLIDDSEGHPTTTLLRKLQKAFGKAQSYFFIFLSVIIDLLHFKQQPLKMLLGHKKRVENIGAHIYVIPSFLNYLLEYELYGDYSKYIERIEIKENHIPKRWKGYRLRTGWRAAFYFRRIPRKGYMLLRYI